MTLFIVGILFIQCIQLAFILINLRYFKAPDAKEAETDTVPCPISILIPARNEEKTIASCIDSIFQQDVTPLEVIVLNDHSEDATELVVTELAKRYDRLKVIQGQTLPKGWLGKSYACQQLADAACGKWLLFLDADTRLLPGALQKMQTVASTQSAGMVSGFPRQVVPSFIEALVVPMMLFTVLMHLPLKYVEASSDPNFSAAHGAFIMIKKSSYLLAGGHEAIKDSMVDDMSLMRAQKLHHQPVRLLKVDDMVEMRMYTNACAVWRGFSKNMFSIMQKNTRVLLVLCSYYFIIFLAPFCLVGSVPFIYILISYCLMVLMKGVIDRKNGLPMWVSFFIPLSVLITIGIGIDSMYKSVTHKGYVWKGRRYE